MPIGVYSLAYCLGVERRRVAGLVARIRSNEATLDDVREQLLTTTAERLIAFARAEGARMRHERVVTCLVTALEAIRDDHPHGAGPESEGVGEVCSTCALVTAELDGLAAATLVHSLVPRIDFTDDLVEALRGCPPA
jgi:hypothetical protein